MSIVGHTIEQDGTAKFTVTSLHHNFQETMTIRQLLAAQPVKPQSPFHAYHYLYDSPISTRSDETLIPHNLETMLTNYLESGHIQGILELIELCLSSGYYLSQTAVLVLMDILLKRTKIKNKRQRKEKMEHLYKTHALLLQTLEVFGPKILNPIWIRFGMVHTFTGKKRTRRQQHQHHTNPTTTDNLTQEHYDDDDYEDERNYGMRISRFEDFWHLVSYCFTQPTNKLSLNNLGCRLALDVLIKLISQDIRSRKDHRDTLSDCLLLVSIPSNAYGVRTNFNRHLDILFSGIKQAKTTSSTLSGALQVQNVDHAMAILNQLVLLSYCGQTFMESSDLVDQTYRRILELEIDTLRHVMIGLQLQFPAFVASMCDIYFEDADSSHVAFDHLPLRSRLIFSVSKMRNYIMKTRPKQTTLTVDSVRQHYLMVIWRWNAYLRLYSYRYDVKTTRNLIETTLTCIDVARKRKDGVGITVDDIMKWKRHLLNLARFCKDNVDDKLAMEITDNIDMMVLSIDD